MLLLTLHHIVTDGWSMGVLLRELAALYAAFARGRPSPLPELPVQYADFAVWQRRWLAGEVLERSSPGGASGWPALPPVLELPDPTGRGRRSAPRRSGSAAPALESWSARLVRRSAAREGATLFMVLLAGLAGAAVALSGRRTWWSGTPIAGRHRLETEGLIGFFVNTLVLRTDLSGDPRSASCWAGARGGAGGLRAPGPAVRAAGRGAAAGAQPDATRRCSR